MTPNNSTSRNQLICKLAKPRTPKPAHRGDRPGLHVDRDHPLRGPEEQDADEEDQERTVAEDVGQFGREAPQRCAGAFGDLLQAPAKMLRGQRRHQRATEHDRGA